MEVRFPSAAGQTGAAPSRVSTHALDVTVPAGATGGRPRIVDADGRSAAAPRLRVVPDTELPADGSFELKRARTRPRVAFFDARSKPRLRYRFRAYGAADVSLELHRGGKLVRRWDQRERTPFATHTVRWNGLTGSGNAGDPGRYRFRVAAAGRGGRVAGRFRFYDHRFPVRGPHSYGDRFGVPRSGGRTHEGQDVWAGCGTRLEAARGGTVQFKGYSGALYGNYLVIDGRQTEADYMYAHLIHPPPVRRGERVRTGEGIGAVGRTGNARGEGCQLHFELWPSGWHDGHPRDPLAELRRWDGWS